MKNMQVFGPGGILIGSIEEISTGEHSKDTERMTSDYLVKNHEGQVEGFVEGTNRMFSWSYKVCKSH